MLYVIQRHAIKGSGVFEEVELGSCDTLERAKTLVEEMDEVRWLKDITGPYFLAASSNKQDPTYYSITHKE